jgi:hypothetical protein
LIDENVDKLSRSETALGVRECVRESADAGTFSSADLDSSNIRRKLR